jgi:hypothetical protein
MRFAGCGLRVVGCGLWVVGCGLRFAVCDLRFAVWVAGCGLWIVGCGLPVVGCGLPVVGCGSGSLISGEQIQIPNSNRQIQIAAVWSHLKHQNADRRRIWLSRDKPDPGLQILTLSLLSF